MTHHLHGKLQQKFFWGLAGIFLLLGLGFLFALNTHLLELLHIEAEAKTELVFSHLSSVQDFVRTTLRPSVRQVLPPEDFLLEAMSTSYVTRKVLVDLNTPHDQYLYRRVALHPRNPASEANALERELIQRFRAAPQENSYKGYRMIDGVEHYVMARPVRFAHECLSCHGNPADAPRVLLERYGAERGFGRTEDELAGLDLVGMPVNKSVQQVRASIIFFGASFYGVAACIFLLIMLFFNRLVVTNLRRLSAIFREYFTAPQHKSILDRLDEGDEIHSLLEAFEAFAAHLREAHAQLADYAANLEDKVHSRTSALTLEAAAHRTDVRLFVDLLGDLSCSAGHKELLQRVLPRIAARFGAVRASYSCAPMGRLQYAWPAQDATEGLPEHWQDMAHTGKIHRDGNCVLVPVATADHVRGVMALCWPEGSVPELEPEIVLALGQQLGIAIENLEAIAALLQQNKLLELTFEGISDPLLLVEERGTVVLANWAARELAGGIQPGTCLQKWFGSFSIPPEQCDTLAAALAGDAPSGLEFALPGPRYLALSVYPLRSSDGAGRAVVYIRDTTTEKRLRSQMQQSEKLAALGKLAAGLAHEINNPLGVISCYAQLLRKSQPDRQAQEDLEVIVRHTRKAQHVLQDLLGLARVNKPATGPCDINAVVRNMAQVFRVQIEKTGVTLELSLADDLPRVVADASAMEQILTNLLVNAFDAVPEETGRIRIITSIAPDRRNVSLVVADNGPGITAEHMPQVFDPFFTTKEIGKGTGLGLTVVHELIREMQGNIEVSGSPGATFSLTLPSAGDSPANALETNGACA